MFIICTHKTVPDSNSRDTKSWGLKSEIYLKEDVL